MKYFSGIGFLALAAFLVVGCGGGSGSGDGGTTPTGGTDFAFGELSGRAAVSNPPVSASSQAIVATGFSGSFSILKLRELNPSLAETRIVASGDQFGQGYGLVSYAIDGSDPVKVTPPAFLDVRPSVGANGKVVFQRNSGPAALPQASGPGSLFTPAIEMCNLDGSGLVNMSVTGSMPSMSASGDKFAFAPNATHISVMNTTTKAQTDIPLPTNDGIFGIALSPDGTIVYALLRNAGDHAIYRLPANGIGGFTVVHDFLTLGLNSIAVSPDGSELACVVDGASILDVPTLQRIGTGNGEMADPVGLPTVDSFDVAYSADGRRLLVSSNPGMSYGLYEVMRGGTVFTRLTSDTVTTTSPTWTPFIKDRTLIAAGGGLLGTHACGVIQGQRAGGGTTSVVALDATTPSSVVMTAQGTSQFNQTNLVFSVDADNIIKLAYANTTAWRGIRAIGSGTPVTSANGTLVSIDGLTGEVVSVLPFSGTRSAGSRPIVSDSGSVRTFTGKFLAVYDKDGKNLAPNGASTVKLDTKSDSITVQ